MASPYRFDAEPEREAGAGRSRTGLSAVTAGATSGGEGYRRSALLPGSRGYAAANFGAAPRTDYVAPVTPPVDETPAPTPPAPAPTPAPAPVPVPTWESERGGAGIEGGGSDANGIAPGGDPGDLSDLIGDIDVSGKTIGGVLGAGLGGFALGPLGALAGGVAGRAIGSALAGDGGGSTGAANEAGSATGGSANSAAAGYGGGYGTGLDGWGGLAEGGRVGPQHLRKDMPMHGAKKGGLGAVTAGKKPFMGGYADGGSVGGYGEAAMYTADPRIQSLLARSPWLMEEMKRISLDKAPVNPANPSTGNMGAYAQGGKVMPHYMDGGPVNALAGPNPPGPDDGFAALDQGEFVVKRDMADKYAPILDDINAGTHPMPGHAGGGEGMGDLDLDMGAQGNYPPSTAESATPDDMMQRLAMMPPEQSQALSGALADPMLMSALFALLGPSFMGVMSALQSQGQQAPGMGMGGGMQPPGMLAIAPDRAGMRPPGGGLGAINA